MSSCCNASVLCCNTKRIEKDVFERCYTFTSEESMGVVLPDTLWEADGVLSPCGTLVLDIESIDTTAATLDLFLNGSITAAVTGLVEGDSIVITSDPLTLVEILASASDVTYKVNLCLTINYECC